MVKILLSLQNKNWKSLFILDKRRLIIILALLIPFAVKGTTYYVSTTGNDTHGKGTVSDPWLTLKHAAEVVSGVGDIIHLNAGRYEETGFCPLAVGVSIEGASESTTTLSYTVNNPDWGLYGGCIRLHSISEGTDGNQSISELTIVGISSTPETAITVRGRKNVKIHDITIKDFHYIGIMFSGRTDFIDAAPTIYATGNELYDCTITNSTGDIYGSLEIGGQDGMLIHHNIIIQPGRVGDTDNGQCIKSLGGKAGITKGVKIYNNILTARLDGDWDFALELWRTSGMELYDNVITGAIDCNYVNNEGYDYGIYIHDNIIGPEGFGIGNTTGVYLEFDAINVIIENNYFRNIDNGISFSQRPGTVIKDITIQYNIFSNIGNELNGKMLAFRGTDDYTVDGLFIYNNTAVANPNISPYYGIHLPQCTNANNIIVVNNIIQSFSVACIGIGDAANIDSLYILNNVFSGNGNNNDPRFVTGTPSYYALENNIKSDSLFFRSSNYNLTPDSPAINMGIEVGLTKDYSGNPIIGIPDIGSNEYQASDAINLETISIYPNPALEYINISINQLFLEPLILRIFDLSGKIHLENLLGHKTNYQIPINLDSGIYVVQIYSSAKTLYTQKVIVNSQ